MSCIVQRLLLMSSLLMTSLPALAGPVNSSEGFPAAQMNVAGDSVWAGDTRIIAHWRGFYAERQYAVAPFRFENTTSHAFSVGVADPSHELNSPAALACSETRAALFFSERKRETPSGAWRELKQLGGIPFGSDSIACAMRPDGFFAIFMAKRSLLLTSSGETLMVPSLGNFARLVSAGRGFILFGASGKMMGFRTEGGRTVAGALTSSPFGSPEVRTRFAGSSTGVVKADSNSVLIANSRFSDIDNSLEKSRRLPISPCEDQQVCGVSLAADGTWAVSGYWGTFLGSGESFVRLSFPNLSRDSGGVAFAHSGRFGSYVYVGNDDGDMGLLSETVALDSNPSPTPDEGRLAVWHRPGFWAPSGRFKRLFPWKINRKVNGRIEQFYGNDVSIHEGGLPNPIPKDWVAWEREAPIQAPRMPLPPRLPGASLVAPWWIAAIHTREAIESLGPLEPRPVMVSVVDSGAQMDHPWLQSALVRKASETPANGYDDDGNGFVDDVSGYDFVEDDALPQDEYGHGTHVAGLLAARDPDSGAPLGVNLNSQLRVVRALDSRGRSNSIDLARAISYAVSEGTDIMNCSWGGGAATQVLRDAFAYAVENNVLVVTSAGNDRLNSDVYPQVPKMFPGVISVAATDEQGALAAFSNWGPNSVAWMAPGQKILSTVRNSELGEMSGTSMASPIAANVASLVWGTLQALDPTLRKEDLRRQTEYALCVSGNKDKVEGKSRCGRIDANRALNWALHQR